MRLGLPPNPKNGDIDPCCHRCGVGARTRRGGVRAPSACGVRSRGARDSQRVRVLATAVIRREDFHDHFRHRSAWDWDTCGGGGGGWCWGWRSRGDSAGSCLTRPLVEAFVRLAQPWRRHSKRKGHLDRGRAGLRGSSKKRPGRLPPWAYVNRVYQVGLGVKSSRKSLCPFRPTPVFRSPGSR